METATIAVVVSINRLEPGHHICRETIARSVVPDVVVNLPAAECSEERPDWGVYRPVVTFQAIERALRRRGHLAPMADRDLEYRFGIVN